MIPSKTKRRKKKPTKWNN